MANSLTRDQIIDQLWERSGHGTERRDVEAAFAAGEKEYDLLCSDIDLWFAEWELILPPDARSAFSDIAAKAQARKEQAS